MPRVRMYYWAPPLSVGGVARESLSPIFLEYSQQPIYYAKYKLSGSRASRLWDLTHVPYRLLWDAELLTHGLKQCWTNSFNTNPCPGNFNALATPLWSHNLYNKCAVVCYIPLCSVATFLKSLASKSLMAAHSVLHDGAPNLDVL